MNIIKTQSEGAEIRVTDANGNQHSVAHITFTLRPNAGFNIGVDVFDSVLVAENLAEVKESVNMYIASVLATAAAAGMPVGE